MNMNEIRRHHLEVAKRLPEKELTKSMNDYWKEIIQHGNTGSWYGQDCITLRAIWFQYRTVWLEKFVMKDEEEYDNMKNQVYREEMFGF